MRRTSSARLAAAVLVAAALCLAGCSAKSFSALVNSKTHHKTHANHHSKRHHKGHKKADAKHHAKHHARRHVHVRPHRPRHVRAKPAASGPDSLVVEPGGGFSSVYQLINHARHSIDVTMFEFADPTAEHDLAAAAKRGVDVRVILDQREHSTNSDAYSYFKAHGIKVVWSSTKFEYTHQKTLTFDNSVSMVQTANLTQRYYATSRDFLVKDTNSADIAAIVRVFNADFAHKPITAGDGHDLVWSPTDSERQILAVINGARKNLRIYSEEMALSTVIDALEAAAKRGVNVQVCGENSDSESTSTSRRWSARACTSRTSAHRQASTFTARWCWLTTGPATSGRSSGRRIFGNLADRNRELGLITSAKPILSSIVKVFGPDFAKGHQVK